MKTPKVRAVLEATASGDKVVPVADSLRREDLGPSLLGGPRCLPEDDGHQGPRHTALSGYVLRGRLPSHVVLLKTTSSDRLMCRRDGPTMLSFTVVLRTPVEFIESLASTDQGIVTNRHKRPTLAK